MRHIPLLLVCLGAFALGSFFAPACEITVADSVVLVCCEDAWGTGAIIDSNCVLTAKHVAVNEGMRIKTRSGAEYRVVRTVLDPDSDAAWCYIDGRFDPRPLRLDRTPLRIGEEITLIGTPYDACLAGCVMTGHVVNINVALISGGEVYTNIDVYDCHAAAGCSGGPVVDRRGHIRGIHVLGASNLGMCVPVEELNQ